jgi:hypothetical protein
MRLSPTPEQRAVTRLEKMLDAAYERIADAMVEEEDARGRYRALKKKAAAGRGSD